MGWQHQEQLFLSPFFGGRKAANLLVVYEGNENENDCSKSIRARGGPLEMTFLLDTGEVFQFLLQ